MTADSLSPSFSHLGFKLHEGKQDNAIVLPFSALSIDMLFTLITNYGHLKENFFQLSVMTGRKYQT
jgi:hypothetical protein